MACGYRKPIATRETPTVRASDPQPGLREEQTGPCGAAERLVVPRKPGNAGGGKGPHFGRVVGKDNGHGDWLRPNNPNNAQASRKTTLLTVKIMPTLGAGKIVYRW
jgi:hypothetical protein